MLNKISFSLTNRFLLSEWASIIKGAAILTIGMAIARGMGVLFSVILGAILVPEKFGAVQYTITLGMLLAIFNQPFGQHVFARFISKYKENTVHLQCIYSNACVIQLVLVLVILIFATVVLGILEKFDIAILVVFVGITVFYSYWGISSGFLDSVRLTMAYLGSNFVQLILIVFLIYFLKVHSSQLAVIIYGISYFLPLALLQLSWPFPIQFDLTLINKKVISDILKFSLPIWISHASYVLFGSIPLILLKYFSGLADVGVYSIGVTLSTIFIFVPSSISTFLMPKTTELTLKEQQQLLKKMLTLSSLINGCLMIIFLLAVNPLIIAVFGEEYFVGISFYAVQAFASFTFGVHSIISAVVVGSGNPKYETISRIMALATTAISSWILIPLFGPLGAAVSMCLGTMMGLFAYGIIYLTIRFSKTLPNIEFES